LTSSNRVAETAAVDVSKAPAKIAGMFDAIAGNYDFLNHLLSAGIDRRWRKKAIRALQLRGSERVLDLCTGTGDLAIAAREATPAARQVIGIDFAGEMLRIGLDKVRQRHFDPSITLARGDATSIPLPDQSVDAITIGFGIRNVENTATACDEMRRVLTDGGRLAILEFAVPTAPVIRQLYAWYFNRVLPAIGRIISRHNAAYGYLPASVGAFATPDDFVKLLRHRGFDDVRASPLTFGIVYLYTARKAR
jgi:demethylmenaquinone methyltransferase/2-methoxy-6-polyprenyl-1,4-benzoquinol methylase